MISKSKLADIKKLHQKKYREEFGLFLIEGWKSVAEAFTAGIEIQSVLVDERRIVDHELLQKLQSSSATVYRVKEKEIATISDTVTTQGIVAVARKINVGAVLNEVLRRERALVVALDSINDPGNLGTIIRTCDWFGVDAVVIGRNSVEMYNPKVVRATMGSLFHLPVVGDIELIAFLTQSRKEHFFVYSAELAGGENVREVTFGKKAIIIIGSESHGVSHTVASLADKKISIPRFGKAESLNAAMACGILLSRIKLQEERFGKFI